MEEKEIVNLLWQRSEDALSVLSEQYGPQLRQLARNILRSEEDAREVVNDSLLGLWDSIPPQRPEKLRAYALKLCRNKALNRLRYERRQRRDGHLDLLLSELEDCLPGGNGAEEALEAQETLGLIRSFLAGETAENRNLFLRRYFFGDEVAVLARDFAMRPRAVSDRLYELRKKLRAALGKEGVVI